MIILKDAERLDVPQSVCLYCAHSNVWFDGEIHCTEGYVDNHIDFITGRMKISKAGPPLCQNLNLKGNCDLFVFKNGHDRHTVGKAIAKTIEGARYENTD